LLNCPYVNVTAAIRPFCPMWMSLFKISTVKGPFPEGSIYKEYIGALYVILTNKIEYWTSRIITFEIQGHYVEIRMNLGTLSAPYILDHFGHLVGNDTNCQY
jgi:hypothetical protein